jgi:hypothetical protein
MKLIRISANTRELIMGETRKLFAQLTGKKTFSTTDMQTMQKLGFEVRFSKQVNTIEELIRA